MSTQHEFELWQAGIMVAAVASADRERALREINHYAGVYAPDGPVEIKEITKRRRKAAQ